MQPSFDFGDSIADPFAVPDTICELNEKGAIFVCNHSAGKDSQAMYLRLRELVPPERLVVIHAHLPEVEWPGTREHIMATIEGHEFLTVQANKTFLQMVKERGFWPSPKYRQCTSDLKRGPIEKGIRRLLKDRSKSLVVNCVGLRAEESSNRAKKNSLTYSNRNSKAGRQWWDWLPIFRFSEDEVFSTIRNAGQQPHWAYAQGNKRLSCVFCFMGCQSDLLNGALHNPELYQRYVEMEEEIGQTLFMPSTKKDPQTLPQLTGIAA